MLKPKIKDKTDTHFETEIVAFFRLCFQQTVGKTSGKLATKKSPVSGYSHESKSKRTCDWTKC